MEIEELTKSQIVLLVLLVSFMTSIATGIVTVSLLAQAPPAITQTVNRVIERTVETVVPAEGQTASVITKETTVVVKEDDLITESIEAVFNSVVRIHEGEATSTPIVALGTIIGEGAIITDRSMVEGTHAVSFGDAVYLYTVSKEVPEAGVAILSADEVAPDSGAVPMVDASSLKLGQTLVGLYGARSDRVSMSILSGTYILTESEEEGGNAVQGLETSIGHALTPGAPLITVFGELAGVSTGLAQGEGYGTFVAASDINAFLSEPAEEEGEEASAE